MSKFEKALTWTAATIMAAIISTASAFTCHKVGDTVDKVDSLTVGQAKIEAKIEGQGNRIEDLRQLMVENFRISTRRSGSTPSRISTSGDSTIASTPDEP